MLQSSVFTRKLVLVCLIVYLVSCSKKALIFETRPVNVSVTRDEKNYFVFENDTIRMVYSFWSKEGSMAFSIYNKLSVPLYVNWKRSSLVLNSQKTDYWTDETFSSTTTRGVGTAVVNYTSPVYQLIGLTAMSSISHTQTNSTRPEKVTFIAPQSYVFKVKDGLLTGTIPINSFEWKKDQFTFKSRKKKIKGEVAVFTEESTPIVFRNFLSISTSEDFIGERYIDHTFYVDKMLRVKYKDHYLEKYDTYLRRYVPSSSFYRPTNFYLD